MSDKTQRAIEQVEKLVRSDELQQAVKQLIPDFD